MSIDKFPDVLTKLVDALVGSKRQKTRLEELELSSHHAGAGAPCDIERSVGVSDELVNIAALGTDGCQVNQDAAVSAAGEVLLKRISQ